MIENKIARVCWNTEDWRKPSGRAGKSKNKRAWELKVGYGHEEWLFDIDKIIDGYHYTYLQVGASRLKYLGQTFNLTLFSIDGTSSTHWLIGKILNVQAVSPAESKRVFSIYRRNGWLKEMEEQLEYVGADINDFRSIVPENFVLFKFQPKFLLLPPRKTEIPKERPLVKAYYYKLYDETQTPPLRRRGRRRKFVFHHGHIPRKRSSERKHKAGTSVIDHAHNRMQDNIYEQLKEKYGEEQVGSEVNGVDLAVEKKDGSYIFYELKTSVYVEDCIREALSQLIFYAYYQKQVRVEKLVIVSPSPTDIPKDVKIFMDLLKNKFSIPIFFQPYDSVNERLDDVEY